MAADGKYAWDLSGVHLVPYRLPELLRAKPGRTVFVAEGEKDVDALAELGLVATCNAMGAGKWRPEYSDHLAGRPVVILPDNDQPGRDHAQQVARSLQGKAASVKVLELPGLPEKGDVSDWISSGGTVAALKMLVKEAPLWVPPGHDQVVAAAEDPELANFHEVETTGDDGRVKRELQALRIGQVADRLVQVSDGWPKRVGPMLFVPGDDDRPRWLDSSPKLFAWIDRQARVRWTKGTSFITQERFFEDLRVSAERFESIEVCPHFPPMPQTYYLHPPVGQATGKLARLVEFFSPDTEVDRNLILAFILTLFWGGSPGRRPAWLITGPEMDNENGRGIGKSTLVEVLAQELVGGYVEVPPTGDMESVKTRLLSPGAAFTRVARLDNVKSLRFSWAELEGLITASMVSGKRLYQGEGARVNTLVWTITVNGEALSEDLAQRCVHIKLKRPWPYSPDWEKEVRTFIRENRLDLWADVRNALENPDRSVSPSGRWAEWECQVLAATPNPEESQFTLKERRDDMNADRREASEFEHFLRAKVKELSGYASDVAHVFIPSQTIAEWLSLAERKNYPTNQASARIRGFGIPWLKKGDKESRRGWVWRGRDVTDAEVFELKLS
jgi:hypothetical protein